MNKNQKKKKELVFIEEKRLTAAGKFMTFLQVIATLLLLVGLFTTLYYPLHDIRVFIKGAILLMSALISLGFLFYSEGYRSLWKDFETHETFDPIILTSGYYFYGIALILALLTLLYFKTSKKNQGKKGHIIYSIFMIVLIIILIVAHNMVEKKWTV